VQSKRIYALQPSIPLIPPMKRFLCTGGMLLIMLIFTLSLLPTNAFAARCQVAPPTYSVPTEAAPGQQIQALTTVIGSCVSDGEDYYAIRVDLTDASSALIISSNSTPIGYNATNFDITVENTITTPSNNGTWHLDIDVYVIRAGGTGGSYLLDYRAASNATIQIGAPTPVPEFPAATVLVIVMSLSMAVFAIRSRKRARIPALIGRCQGR